MSAIAAPLPAWVCQPDGRLVPFDPDRITLALFDASERLGNPDTFLARELTEGVLFFLGQEFGAAAPTTCQITETVVKVVRELGHAPLARAFAQARKLSPPNHPPLPEAAAPVAVTPVASPSEIVQDCLRNYSLVSVFSRDLRAAHREGLITLHGLDTPAHLYAATLELTSGWCPRGTAGAEPLRLLDAFEQAGQAVGRVLALDSPEHWLGGTGVTDHSVSELRRVLELGQRLTGASLRLNLNCSSPPAWAALTEGPLFHSPQADDASAANALYADALLDFLMQGDLASYRMAIDWHLGEADLAPGERQTHRLTRLARYACDGRPVAFVFDRSRRPLTLGPGLDRLHPATLLAVSVHLPNLLDVTGVRGNPDLLVKKVRSLASMAVSAGLQKRAYLRDRQRGVDGDLLSVNRRFLLARARLVVMPVGLEAVVQTMTGDSLNEGSAGFSLARRLVQGLSESLDALGRRANLPVCLSDVDTGADSRLDQPAGLMVEGTTTPWREQLRRSGQLHAFGDGATLTLVLPPAGFRAEELIDLLRFAARATGVQRLVIHRHAPRQLTFAAG